MHECVNVELLFLVLIKIPDSVEIVLGVHRVQPRVAKIVGRIEVHEVVVHMRKNRADLLGVRKATGFQRFAGELPLVGLPVCLAILPDVRRLGVVRPLPHDERGFERRTKENPALIGMGGGEGLECVPHLALDYAHEWQETDQRLVVLRPTFRYRDGQG